MATTNDSAALRRRPRAAVRVHWLIACTVLFALCVTGCDGPRLPGFANPPPDRSDAGDAGLDGGVDAGPDAGPDAG